MLKLIENQKLGSWTSDVVSLPMQLSRRQRFMLWLRNPSKVPERSKLADYKISTFTPRTLNPRDCQ